MDQEKIIEQIVNKQFEIAGVKFNYSSIPADNMIKVIVKRKEKLIPWYEHYKFLNENQYLEWKKWSIDKLKDHNLNTCDMDEIDLIYGMNYELKKPKDGELF